MLQERRNCGGQERNGQKRKPEVPSANELLLPGKGLLLDGQDDVGFQLTQRFCIQAIAGN